MTGPLRAATATALCIALAAAVPVSGQDAGRSHAEAAEGVVLRWLDRTAGEARDLTLAPGETVTAGGIEITLRTCRYPVEDPAGDAFAYLTIRETGVEPPVFAGWMIASSPALNAMDHRRYDVWVLRCRISPAEGTAP